MDCDVDDSLFSGYNNKLNTPKFIEVNRSDFRKGTDNIQDNAVVVGDNYIPASGSCFVKCII